MKPLGYNASKAALNMVTVNLAWELRDTKIKVNSICPSFTATDLNGDIADPLVTYPKPAIRINDERRA